MSVNEQRIAELEKELAATRKDLEYYRRISRELTAALNALGVKVWIQSDVSVVASTTITETKDLIEKGKHMTMFHELIKSNAVVADAWKKFMLALRLCGFDGTNKDETN